MSFASNAKNELCDEKIERKCCAISECYGALLFCHTFNAREIRITTSNDKFAERIPKLFKRAFSVSFDRLPVPGDKGKKSFVINNPEKIASIYNTFDLDASNSVSLHINFAMIEDECCRTSFVRGAFLSGGSVTDPEKGYHLEMATPHHSVARELISVLLDMGFYPKESTRAGNTLIYFKQADAIADFLTTIGAPVTSMDVITAKVEKEMRNTITRQINCDSANTDKTVAAAQEQLASIKQYAAKYGIETLPEPLKDAALLRITNPEASLADLAKLSFPAVSKSCLNHRLKKIMALAEEG